MQQQIEEVYRTESRRVYATLVRLLGDFDFAEDVLQEAFIAAMQQWPREGLPSNPRAWLVSVARFKAIDRLRSRSRLDQARREIALQLEDAESWEEAVTDDIGDDRLRLIFTCCHPALAPAIQIALTLREVCGLTTEEIADAFLVPPATLAQRIVRGKAKIRTAGIPYEVPARKDLPERLEAALMVIYLVFNEGYHASGGASLLRADLSGEAIRLGRLLVELLPDPEALGLLALMLMIEARRPARVDAAGDIVLLEDQDRTRWDQALIGEGRELLRRAVAGGEVGPFILQAAIAETHAEARAPADTDWARIVSLYDLLLRAAPSPVVELNRAVAVAMVEGPEPALLLVDELLGRRELGDYHLAYATRADLCRRLGRGEEAAEAYRQALSLCRQEPERRFLQRRLAELREVRKAPGY